MSRVVIDVSKEEHQKIKALAALQGKSIKNYILEQVLPAKDDVHWEELKTVLAERIGLAESKPPATQTFEELTQAIIQSK